MADARPQPLPPETRTVGQLVAETVRLYGRRFWAALPLGVPVALADVTAADLSLAGRVSVLIASAPVFTLAFILAGRLALDVKMTLSRVTTAFAVGVALFIPAALFFPWFALVSVAWLALVGLAVPAALAEDLRWHAAFRRGFELGRADYIHALGSLAAFVVVFALTRIMLGFLLRDFGDQATLGAVFIADVVIAPILFLGASLLYVDQAARVVDSARSKPRRKRRRNADVHPADLPDGTGRPDVEVEPRTAARGEP
jgi:hypothetical protein